MTTYKVIVTGSRDWSDYQAIRNALAYYPVRWVIQGGARGADRIAQVACDDLRLPCMTYPAHWERDGNSAGIKRNIRMAEDHPDAIVFAFSDDLSKSRGTSHMVFKSCIPRGLPVFHFWHASDGLIKTERVKIKTP